MSENGCKIVSSEKINFQYSIEIFDSYLNFTRPRLPIIKNFKKSLSYKNTKTNRSKFSFDLLINARAKCRSKIRRKIRRAGRRCEKWVGEDTRIPPIYRTWSSSKDVDVRSRSGRKIRDWEGWNSVRREPVPPLQGRSK